MSALPTFTTLRAAQDGRVLTVVLDSPPRNFLGAAMIEDIAALRRRLERDDTVGAVVFASETDGVFCQHGDVDMLIEAVGRVPPLPDRAGAAAFHAVRLARRLPGGRALIDRTPAAGLGQLLRVEELFAWMNRSDKVFVAAVNGMAFGAGCLLALACDVRIMADADEPLIGLPETALGFVPGAGSIVRLAHAVGPQPALRLLLDARPLTPAEALAAGLVDEVVAPDALGARAHAVASRAAKRAPAVVSGVKRTIYDGLSRSRPRAVHAELIAAVATYSRPATLAALEAYARRARRSRHSRDVVESFERVGHEEVDFAAARRSA